MRNYRQLLELCSPSAFVAAVSSGYYGVIALAGDKAAEAMRLALLMPWLAEDESPDDVLALAGAQRRLPRYPNETAAQYRARLLRWKELYDNAGTPARVNAEIVSAGLNGTVFFDASAPGPGGVIPWWSQFWIQTTTTGESINTIIGIAKKWKSSRWLFRSLIFNVAIVTHDPIAVGDVVTEGEAWVG